MSTENVREHKRKHRYTFVLVSDAKSEGTRSFSVPRWGFFSGLIAAVTVIAIFVVALIIYTPIGAQLPISNTELSKIYGKRIVDLQRQLRLLIQQVDNLKAYNLQLRKVLGEPVEQKLSQKDFNDDSMSAQDWTSNIIGPADSSIEMLPEDYESGEVAENQALKVGIGEPAGINYMMKVASIPLVAPVRGYESRSFSAEDYHYGIDYAGKQGTPITAAGEGVVIFSDWTYDDGYTLMIAHTFGFMTVYKHNLTLLKRIGETVRRGEAVALLGNTGIKSYGPHLHFEVWKDGIIQNPKHYLLSNN